MNGRMPPPVRPPVRRFELDGIRPAARAGIALAALIPVAVVVWLVLGTGGSKSPTPAGASTTMARTNPRVPATRGLTAQTIAHYPLAKAVAGVNVSDTAKGMLPLSSCMLTNPTTVTCTQPTQAVDVVIFRTYPSAKALYAAYEARVSAIAQGPFRSNFGNCTENMTNGEVAWNHDFKHPSIYPMSDFTSGQITDDKAAGRVYCTFNNSDLYLVWTQDDGHVLGELSGAPHVDAYVWWRQVHHSVVMPGSPNMMKAMTGPTSTSTMQTTTSSKSMSGMPASKGSSSMPSSKGSKK